MKTLQQQRLDGALETFLKYHHSKKTNPHF
jgi:hypothetical protein